MLRALVLATAVALFLLGVLTVVASGGDPDAISAGWWLILLFGGVAVLVVLERQRYRSAAAERSGGSPGPGGGEDASHPLESRFRATDEVFLDPTTGRRMRVWLDDRTGERRYRAES
ncbi:MAG TPA: hypothetical protein VGK63_10415 [Candidatus Limnocylindrales bacterium]